METNPLDGLKMVQKSRIRDSFNDAPRYGCLVTGGFRMDVNRDDIDNLTRLRDRMAAATATTTIRDYNNQFHTVTGTALSGIIGELVDFGLGLYSKKWQMEQAIDAAITEKDVLAVTW